MQLVKDKISIAELQKMSEKMFTRIVKAVVDIEQGIMAVDAEMHVDEECFLLDEGSQQDNLWGINLHPDQFGNESFVEFDSMINIRPGLGNRSRYVENPLLRNRIISIVNKLVIK